MRVSGRSVFLSLTEAEMLDTLKTRAVPPPKLFSRNPRLLATYQKVMEMEKLGSYDCLLKAIRTTNVLWRLKVLNEAIAGLMAKCQKCKTFECSERTTKLYFTHLHLSVSACSLSLPPPSSLSYKL